jgi:DNA helicase-2/ATP-dependent DNA helicase PcrA
MDDNHIDDHVDNEIAESIVKSKNFFMFAGAGSGKTRSLVGALDMIMREQGDTLLMRSKKAAVITYTNAACDEILRRIGYNPLFAVSTIHSFLWELIKPFQVNIKEWLKNKLEADIAELETKQIKARSKDYSPDINKKKIRKERLDEVVRFTYNPNGENVGKDSLDHAEVISMGAEFISSKATMQRVLISKFPILLIDESQDTKKELVDALLSIEATFSKEFVIGMFGDVMQRIYTDGKADMEAVIPSGWAKPDKIMNHRSNKRIIQLANAIRATADKREQRPRTDKSEGVVRLFIASNDLDKKTVEEFVFETMSLTCSDDAWKLADKRKLLVLEHSMAAKRAEFETLETALAKPFSQSFRDGTLSELSFLMNIVYPIVTAKLSGDEFTVMKLWRKHSEFLKSAEFKIASNQKQILVSINEKITALSTLWKKESPPTCLDVYRKLVELNIFELPKRIEEVIDKSNEPTESISALRSGLAASFDELVAYWNYINDSSQFSTHQGVKGLEFDRVAVIMDDESAGGFLFSYEKLFGAKDLSKTDKEHSVKGEDNAVSRTMRLLYVTCTRAKESLALIAYTANSDAVRKTATYNGWFSDSEIVGVTNEVLPVLPTAISASTS